MTTAIKQQVKTRFLILSDTHSATPSPDAYDSNAAFRVPLPRADVLLHCGDLTMVGHLFEYEKTLGMLESAEAGLKLVIAGNHDISLDGEYYERKGAWMHRHGGHDPDLPRKAREMWLGERAQRAGVTYLEEGTHSFTLENGARLRVRVYTSPRLRTMLTLHRSTRLRTSLSSMISPSRISGTRTGSIQVTSALQVLCLSSKTRSLTSRKLML